MKQSKKKWYFRSFLIAFLPLFIVLFIVLSFILLQEYKNRIELAKLEQLNILERQDNIIRTGLKSTVSDIVFLTKLNELENFIQEGEKHWESLCNEIKSFSESRGIYDQIRLLDLEGKEVVRVNYNKNNAQVVPKNELQKKIGRYYYKYARILLKDQIYISALDLNVEKGEIEQPYKPVLRFCFPLYDENLKIKLILIVNYKVQPLIFEIIKVAESDKYKTLVLNKNSYFLIGEKKEDEWGFMFSGKDSINFENRYQDVWSWMLKNHSGIIKTDKGQFVSKSLLATDLINIDRTSVISIYETKESCTHVHLVSFLSQDVIRDSFIFPLTTKYFLIFFVLSLGLLFFALVFARSSSEKRLINQKIKMQYSFINSLVETIPNPIYYVDYVNKEFGCNKGFEELTGKSKLDLQSMKIEKLFTASALHKKLTAGERKKGVIKSNEIKLKYPDGNIHSLIFHKASVFVLDHKIGIVGVFNDVTEIRATERALKASQENLQISNRTKDKFFSILAHDLKNSFHSIIGFTDLINMGSESMDKKDLKINVRSIHNTADSTYQLLINLLDWANLQEGSLKLKPVSFGLFSLVEECVKLFESKISEKELDVRLNISKNQQLYADKDMMFTVFRNLIGNAITYTFKKGLIEIDCKQKKDSTELYVTDTGQGIEKEILPNIFNLDVRSTNRKTYNEYGTGIGLALCKEFVELHGGKISVGSEPGKGTSFSFYLPKILENVSSI